VARQRLGRKCRARDDPRRSEVDLPGDRAGCAVLNSVRKGRTVSAATPAQPILSARGIVNRFGKQELHDNVSLDVLPGEILGIAGGSGSGKSVLLRTLTGLHRPVHGDVRINGTLVEKIDAAQKAALIGVLFQQGALFSSLSVAQNIMLPIRHHTRLPVQQQERIAAMKLELTGMPADSGVKFPFQLSG